MSLIKYNPFRPVNFDQLLGDLTGRSMSEFMGSDFVSSTPSVNVVENDNSFIIQVAAPGLNKEDFQIELEKDHLIISANKEEVKENESDGKVMRREFNYSSFRRSFHISEKISKEDISANYSDGVLSINLAKKAEAKDEKKTIEIV